MTEVAALKGQVTRLRNRLEYAYALNDELLATNMRLLERLDCLARQAFVLAHLGSQWLEEEDAEPIDFPRLGHRLTTTTA